MSDHEYIVRTKDLYKIYTTSSARRSFLGDLLSAFLKRLNIKQKEQTVNRVEVRALDGINLDIRQGEYISLMGPSGSGKSTLFNMIGGLDEPTSGVVFIDSVDMSTLSPEEMAWLRNRKIGYIFQSYNLMPNMSALENVTFPMVFAGMDAEAMYLKGMELLRIVGLDNRADHKPNELSGGQQQRVAIARAFANDPMIVLADEPTGNLDRSRGREIIEILKKMNKERGVTVISATHDEKMLDVSDRIVDIRDGRVERIRERDEIVLTLGTMEGE